MASILTQLTPDVATETVLYTFSSASSFEQLICCNKSADDETIRVGIRTDSEETLYYLYYGKLLPPGTFIFSKQLDLAKNTQIVVWSEKGNVDFTLIGGQ